MSSGGRWPSEGMGDLTISVNEAAARLGCSAATVRRRIDIGEIAAFPRGGAWRVLVSSLGLTATPTDADAAPHDRVAVPSLVDRLAGRPWLLSPEDVADVIGWPEEQVRYYMRRRQLPARKVGAKWVCPQDAFVAWCAELAA